MIALAPRIRARFWGDPGTERKHRDRQEPSIAVRVRNLTRWLNQAARQARMMLLGLSNFRWFGHEVIVRRTEHYFAVQLFRHALDQLSDRRTVT